MAEPQIGPYRLLRLLHQGGQGRVFLGHDDRLQRRVAVKIYDLPEAAPQRRRSLDEARLLARLQHPRVVQIYDVIASEQHLAMVMEYVPGCDLEELLAVVDLPLADSLDIARDIASVLGAAASRQVVHGDLKAANVLLDREGRVKLADFGIAGIVGEGHSGRGSLSCLSPEQARGERLDARSDLFALGCLLYRLLSGEFPFFRHGWLDRAGLLTGAAPPLPEITPAGDPIPGELRQLLDQLLAPDPAVRPASLAGLRQRLYQLRARSPQAVRGGLPELAAPVFREETASELPLPLPEDLLQPRDGGRGWLARARGPGAWSRPALCWSAVVLTPLLLWGGWNWAAPRPLRVYLPPAEVNFAPQVRMPVAEGLDWLESEVRAALGRARPGLQWATLPEEGTDEILHLRLQCQQELCILGLRRENGDTGPRYRQALLPPAAGRVAWEDLIGETVATLYARP